MGVEGLNHIGKNIGLAERTGPQILTVGENEKNNKTEAVTDNDGPDVPLKSTGIKEK